MGAKAFLGFVPWIIFWVVSGPSTWEYAAGGALVAALILLIPSHERGRIKLLEIVSVLFFGALTIAGLVLDHSRLLWLEEYAQAISSAVLAVVVLGSLAFTPFTEQYAREQVPQQFWSTPQFKHVNRTLTLVWGLTFAVCAVLGMFAQPDHGGSAWLNWIIPIAVLVGAFKFTAWYPERVKADARAAGTAPA
ncbi:hypothetical protein [Catellatospora citrea]|uniref:Intracellular septation protein A n=1 Tax=Catellatospora citrea TaxID=53366 RepID=A0A8J3P0G0_9ACTN|nr:hypothetical protein [Catellatospora citrea]RKE00399.1 intracellular septation protein A [Catellatospora citrea]GIF99388.1 hypothetical protein Cci01nite_44820 [Catellatospora citrea]